MERPASLSRVDIQRFFLLLVAFEILLVAAWIIERSLGSPFWVFSRLLDIDGENSFASWFSSTQLFLIGLVFFLWGWPRRSGPGPDRWFILLIAAGFVFLSADEALYIHESITRGLLKYDYLYRFEGGHGMWIPFYLGALALLVVVCQKQVRRFWKHQKEAFLLMAGGAALFLFGAVGLEIAAYEWIAKDSPMMLAEVAAEEFLEMFGASVILYAAMGLLIPANRPEPAVSFATTPIAAETTANRVIASL